MSKSTKNLIRNDVQKLLSSNQNVFEWRDELRNNPNNHPYTLAEFDDYMLNEFVKSLK